MRTVGLVALLAACSFSPGRLATGDGGGSDDPDMGVPPGSEQWVFDTAAELAATGHVAESLTIEPAGTLTPAGYIYGGLLMSGKQNMQLWNTMTTTFDYAAAAALTPDGTTLWDTEYINTLSSLAHAGVTVNTVFTIWFEGEVYLDANDIVSISADAAGFVDLRLPTGWIQIVSTNNGVQVTPAVATAGWYPVRLGWGEGSSNGFFDFQRGPSGATVHFSRDRLRAPTSQLRGTMRAVFFRQIFGGAQTDNGFPIVAFEPAEFYPPSNITPTPLGSGNADADDWSARWYGQFYATMAGTYQLRAVTDDGNQIMLAGFVGASNWSRGSGTGAATTTATADLQVGWHDIALDYNQVSGNRAAEVEVAMAPEPALVGQPIPRDRLRPVEPRRARLISETRMFSSLSIPNDAAGPTRTIVVDGLPGEVVTALDITWRIATSNLDQLQFIVQRPGGNPVVISNHPAGSGINGHFYVHTTAAGVIGQAVGGTWTFRVQDDTSSSNSGAWSELAVAIHTSGGPGAVAETSSWVSPVRDTGVAPVEVSAVTWTERAAIPSEVFLRACAAPDCSDNPPWGAAIANNGTASLATQYIQAKIVMHSDGTTEPELDRLAITYAK